MVPVADIAPVTATAGIEARTHGSRAKCLQRLVRLGLPVPQTVALSFATVHRIAAGQMPCLDAIVAQFGDRPLFSVRPSSEDPDWGGPGAMLDVGMNDALHAALSHEIGPEAATALYMRSVQGYAVHVARLDADAFHLPETASADALAAMLAAYEAETDEPFPQDPAVQLGNALRSMARVWEGTTARLLRRAKGAPEDAGLGLVVQRMALGLAGRESGMGHIHFVDPLTGAQAVGGQFVPGDNGEPGTVRREAVDIARARAGDASLEARLPDVYRQLEAHGATCRAGLREEMDIEFAVEAGKVLVLDAVRLQRSSRAAVRIAVSLAEDGVIPRHEAILRVEPGALPELLHRQVAPRARRDIIARGIAASPGAARGRIVFSASAAQAAAARGEPCVLVRRETTPEDIRGMHAAQAVLTERGGITSHAAVIGRGLGLPCVVGASDIQIDLRGRRLTVLDGRSFAEGEEITVDGTSGQVLAGLPDMHEPALDDAFRTLLAWADSVRDIGIRANADTPADARVARTFEAEGIGLCRTEHMFFEEGRLNVMREMIFADAAEDRRATLDRLLPMQRADFRELFETMQGKPVCIRLFDPPLHEFMPSSRSGLRELADALNLPLADVTQRVEALAEYNPMLGLRGVRLGITVPEIYEMQARAIFEATLEASANGDPVVPEIMIPLVSARREVELVKSRVDGVAAAVRNETGRDFTYRLGVMAETPRACLRAGEIAQNAAFLSFGTNDLTQMTYGLSRDDAGRFMSAYVQQGVFAEDPFHTLDTEGVGELLQIAAERGRAGRPDVTLAVCGEHGGSQAAIAFCRRLGFDYVSCSPFRVPVARLAAAQLALRDGS
jgi:pyruvate,orthophosphate dikinase